MFPHRLRRRELDPSAKAAARGAVMASQLLIITIMRSFVFAFFCWIASETFASQTESQNLISADTEASARAVIHEMNLAREKPALYASFVEGFRTRCVGQLILTPGTVPIRTKEGTRAIDEAIGFLRSAQPQARLTLSPGMCRAAADHCAEQACGQIGHRGRGGSKPGDRINRYGSWSGVCGENVAYGQLTARDVVVALIVDDGVANRGHRKNIFDGSFNFAGAASGPHAKYRSVCNVNFAGAYVDRPHSPEGKLLARNF